MNKLITLVAIVSIIFATGCKDQQFKKTKTGRIPLEYKTFGGSGDRIKYGNAVQFKAFSYYGDSIMSTPFDTVTQVIEIDSSKLPKEYIEVFTSANNGDSIVTRTLTDSIKKYAQLPPFAKDGKYFGYHFKIVNIITDPLKIGTAKAQTMASMRKVDSLSTEKQKAIDDKILSDYLAKNNIKATKTAKGTYVEVINPGQGDSITMGKAITVDYRGKTLEGKEFDSSYDSTGKSVKPYTFVIGRGAIEGWSDGLVYFKKGGSGKLFVPSSLAYGSRGAGADIKPNTPLMFDVTITDVLTEDQYRAKMEEQQKKRQEMFKQMQQQHSGRSNPDSIPKEKK